MNPNEPADARIRLAIVRGPDDAPRGAVTTFCAEHSITRKTFYAIRTRVRAEGQAAAPEPLSRRPKSSPTSVSEAPKDEAVKVRSAMESSGLDHSPISVHDKMVSLGMETPSSASLARIFRERNVARTEPRPGRAGDKATVKAVPKPTAQHNFTDPDPRIMKTADGSYHYCFNGQAVVDAGHQVIVAAEMSQASNDYGQLAPMAERALRNLGRMPGQFLADAGYCSKANLEHARGLHGEHGTEFLITTRRMKHTTPIPETPRGRIPSGATVGERMALQLKTKPGREAYARRKAIVEPVFGQINTRQSKHVLLRGLEKATSEWKLLAACHNLMKIHGYQLDPAN